jgi:hypothetical protein
MRILILKYKIGILLLLGVILGCAPSPKAPSWSHQMHLPDGVISLSNRDARGGLWFVTSNYSTGGTLGRIDLKTGKINSKLLLVGADTQLFPDGKDGLFILNRMRQDSVTAVQGPFAKATAYRQLPRGSNPQAVVRDRQGRVWLTLSETDQVLALSEDLTNTVAALDFSHLAADHRLSGGRPNVAPGIGVVSEVKVNKADLASMLLLGENRLLVAAQRLHREGGPWRPDPQSALIEIDTEALKVSSTQFLAAANPQQLGVVENSVWLVGGGDFSSRDGSLGSLLRFPDLGVSRAPEHEESLGKILAVDFSEPLEVPILIVWYPQQQQSCVEFNQVKLVCAGNSSNQGYVFSHLRRLGSHIFVTYQDQYTQEIWLVSVRDRKVEQKVSVALPVMSLSFGP